MTRCELCGDSYHDTPDPTPDIFGLICPGASASLQVAHDYLLALAGAYAEHVGKLITEAQDYAAEIERRKKLWYERERTEVTHQELQADCDERVGEEVKHRPWLRIGSHTSDEAMAAQLAADESGRTLEVDPPHLVLPTPLRASQRPIVSPQERRAQSNRETDALLYVDPHSDQEEK